MEGMQACCHHAASKWQTRRHLLAHSTTHPNPWAPPSLACCSARGRTCHCWRRRSRSSRSSRGSSSIPIIGRRRPRFSFCFCPL